MSADAAHIEGTPSFIRMASKERIAMHPAPSPSAPVTRVRDWYNAFFYFKVLSDNQISLLIAIKLLLIHVFLLLTMMGEIHLFLKNIYFRFIQSS
jgi:hypothetical protein